jgi:hypothetical protein
MWNWLEKTPYSWGFMLRVLLKASLLFVLINVVFVLAQPLPLLGKKSVYGWLVPYRDRLPYGENPAAYNLSTNNLETMFATHALNRPKSSDEFRVMVIGDSATWGILLDNSDTTTGKLNALNLTMDDGRVVRAYNVGHPIMSVTKDLLLLEYAQQYQADLVVWLVTLESLPYSEQLKPPIVQNNAPRIRDLIARYALALDAQNSDLVDNTFLDNTFVGQRRPIADWLRLQLYGISWATTGIDQVYGDFTPRSNDFAESDFPNGLDAWYGFNSDTPFSTQDIALDVIRAGHTMMGDVPILLVNEPIFVADGENSDIRTNFWYPKWAYDRYRELLIAESATQEWQFLDVWNTIAPSEFTDSPVHLTPQGSQALAQAIADAMMNQVFN